MKKIAYLLHWNAGPNSGVFKKVVGQVNGWLAEGCEVRIFLLHASDAPRISTSDAPHDISVCSRSYGGAVDRFVQAERLVDEVLTWQPDLLYQRYDIPYPALVRLAEAVPTMLEVNSNDLSEYRLGPAHRYLYNRLFRGRLLRRCAGMVFVSYELAGMPHFARYARPSAVIGNGLDFDAVAPRPPPSNKRPQLVFIGTPGQPWHGLDKIVWLAARFAGWDFHVIGPGPADLGYHLPANVVAHGVLNAAGYACILAVSDAAFGTLALHRKGMNEASPLKVREYLAYGIPTIIGYQDTDFPEPAPFLLQLPNVPSNVEDHLPSIRRFVEQWKGHRVARADVAHLDVRVKEEARVAFFEEVLNGGRTSRRGATYP